MFVINACKFMFKEKHNNYYYLIINELLIHLIIIITNTNTCSVFLLFFLETLSSNWKRGNMLACFNKTLDESVG